MPSRKQIMAVVFHKKFLLTYLSTCSLHLHPNSKTLRNHSPLSLACEEALRAQMAKRSGRGLGRGWEKESRCSASTYPLGLLSYYFLWSCGMPIQILLRARKSRRRGQPEYLLNSILLIPPFHISYCLLYVVEISIWHCTCRTWIQVIHSCFFLPNIVVPWNHKIVYSQCMNRSHQ